MTITREDLPKVSYPAEKKVIRYGVKIPFQVNENGGIKIVSGRELDDQDIISNFLDTSNKNAFMQNLVNFSSYTFKPNKSEIVASIIKDARLIFEKYEKQHRFKLVEESISVDVLGNIVAISLSYESLENNTINNLQFGIEV